MKRIHTSNLTNKGSSFLQAIEIKTLVPMKMLTLTMKWLSFSVIKMEKLPKRKRNRHGTTKSVHFSRRNRIKGVLSSLLSRSCLLARLE